MSELGSDPLFQLEGRSVALFGACGGLGRPIAQALAARGVHLTLADLNDAHAQELANDLQTKALPIGVDVTDEAACTTVMDAAISRFGRIDGVVNAAGSLLVAPALDLEVNAFQKSLELNVTAPLLISRVAARAMAQSGGGAIVHMASVSSLVANPDYGAYASAKAALSQLIRVLAREWAKDDIRINALGPAMTETPLNSGYLADPTFRANALSVIPLGRFGEPEDLIAPLIMLLSPGGGFITGQTIYIDGGRTLV